MRNLTEEFVETAEKAGAEVVRCKNRKELSAALVELCAREGAKMVGLAGLDNALTELFRTELTSSGIGVVLVGEGYGSMLEELSKLDVGVVKAEAGICETGAVLIAADPLVRLSAVFPKILVSYLRVEKIVRRLSEVTNEVVSACNAGLTVSLISGPSSTTDIESLHVKGAHGPRKVVIALAEVE